MGHFKFNREYLGPICFVKFGKLNFLSSEHLSFNQTIYSRCPTLTWTTVWGKRGSQRENGWELSPGRNGRSASRYSGKIPTFPLFFLKACDPNNGEDGDDDDENDYENHICLG